MLLVILTTTCQRPRSRFSYLFLPPQLLCFSYIPSACDVSPFFHALFLLHERFDVLVSAHLSILERRDRISLRHDPGPSREDRFAQFSTGRAIEVSPARDLVFPRWPS